MHYMPFGSLIVFEHADLIAYRQPNTNWQIHYQFAGSGALSLR